MDTIDKINDSDEMTDRMNEIEHKIIELGRLLSRARRVKIFQDIFRCVEIEQISVNLVHPVMYMRVNHCNFPPRYTNRGVIRGKSAYCFRSVARGGFFCGLECHQSYRIACNLPNSTSDIDGSQVTQDPTPYYPPDHPYETIKRDTKRKTKVTDVANENACAADETYINDDQCGYYSYITENQCLDDGIHSVKGEELLFCEKHTKVSPELIDEAQTVIDKWDARPRDDDGFFIDENEYPNFEEYSRVKELLDWMLELKEIDKLLVDGKGNDVLKIRRFKLSGEIGIGTKVEPLK